MLIVGAGLTGLLAGVMFPGARILEQMPRADYVPHRAVLRFREDTIARATGIDFQRVRVQKGIWWKRRFVSPNPQVSNLYSRKVTGLTLARSIWDIAPVDRYVAPHSFQEQLLQMLWDRIDFHYPWALHAPKSPEGLEPLICTIPMRLLFNQHRAITGAEVGPEFRYAKIGVWRFAVKGSQTHQTIYYPDPTTPIYRASLTGDFLLVEYAGEPLLPDQAEGVLTEVLWSFGLTDDDVEWLDYSHREYGKLVPISETWRKNFIFEMTQLYHIYSAGRFAIWKNVLMDDVYHDLTVIRRLIRQGGHGYDRSLWSAR